MDMNRTGILRDPSCLEHSMGAYHPENPHRLRVLYEMLDSGGLRGRFTQIPARPASREELERVHAPDYLDRLAATSGREHSYLDPDTSACAESWNAAIRAAGGLCETVNAVVSGSLRNAFALVRPPGHHAEHGRAKGFCLLNNLAVAARHAREVLGLPRILIVDWDLHHGNGSQNAFLEDPTVLYISTHQHPFYPGSGALNETGEGAGRGYTLNIPLSAGCGDGEYAALFERIVRPVSRAFRPDLVLVSAGMDIHRADPLGAMGVTPQGFAALTRAVMEIADATCDGKLVLALEGGYDLEGLRDSVRAVLEELDGSTRTDPFAAASTARVRYVDSVVQSVRDVHARNWPVLQPS
jgi:acetoin utilization deacetylase AcuC-like enzyme